MKTTNRIALTLIIIILINAFFAPSPALAGPIDPSEYHDYSSCNIGEILYEDNYLTLDNQEGWYAELSCAGSGTRYVFPLHVYWTDNPHALEYLNSDGSFTSGSVAGCLQGGLCEINHDLDHGVVYEIVMSWNGADVLQYNYWGNPEGGHDKWVNYMGCSIINFEYTDTDKTLDNSAAWVATLDECPNFEGGQIIPHHISYNVNHTENVIWEDGSFTWGDFTGCLTGGGCEIGEREYPNLFELVLDYNQAELQFNSYGNSDTEHNETHDLYIPLIIK